MSAIPAIASSHFVDGYLPAFATPSGKFLYEEGFLQSPLPGQITAYAVWGFAIGSDGMLTSVPNAPYPPNGLGNNPTGMVMDRQGKFLFVSADNGGVPTQNRILTFAIDQSTGELTTSSTLSSTSQAWLAVHAVDPTNQFLYASSVLSTGDAISVYSISPANGALTEIPGSPFSYGTPEGHTSAKVTVSPSGGFVYAYHLNTSYTTEGIYAFSVDPATNALTLVPGSPFPVGWAWSIEFSISGNFLFAVHPGTDISVYGVDTVKGTIGLNPSFSFARAAYWGQMLIDRGGRLLIVRDSDKTVSIFAISSTGALTPVQGSPFNIASWTSALVVATP